MASAPPLETSAFVGHPPLPSYEEAMVSNPQYPSMPHAPGDMKTSVPQDPAQAYSPMYPSPPQQGQPVTTPVVSVQTVYVQPGMKFGSFPVQAHCPVCTRNVITRLEYTSGALAWLSCAGLTIFGLKDVTHHCPNCSSVLGVYKRL
uniref:Lipopolysaccharide-induced TNF factor n=1 Tax=Cyprinus carpio carpio TaxID=630221 RepID=A0A9J8AW45_CYPCA